ncbi:MAG: hypothetical protein JW866_09885, partial [Ignavibacteriales bacterium]|nr:hypothetical protein [Ignavibacteriales bacterium]
AYPKFSIIIDDIQIEQNKLEGNYIYKQETIENQALALLKNSRNETTEFLTNYSISAAENTHNAWKKLYEKLVVKYLDGIKKDEYFRPVNIGYPEEFKKLIVKTEGDNKIVKRFPIEIENSFRDLVRAGDEYLENKNYIEATKSYQRALELRPNEVEIQSKVDKIKSFLDSIDEIHKENFL